MTVYDTIISNASITDSLFSATLTQSNGLESLANAALQRGIDAYTNKDYEGAVKEFKRSVGLGRSSSFAADAAQYLAMTYLKLEDPENAIKAYKSALQVDPTATTFTSSWATSTFLRKNTRTHAPSMPRRCG